MSHCHVSIFITLTTTSNVYHNRLCPPYTININFEINRPPDLTWPDWPTTDQQLTNNWPTIDPIWTTLTPWHQESVVLVSRFFAFSCVLKFYKMQKLETQFFFSSTSKNNNYVFSIYTRYQGLLLHICSDLVRSWSFDVLYVFWVFLGSRNPKY